VGKLQTFLLSADEAFGQADGTAIQVMNRAEFPKELGIRKSLVDWQVALSLRAFRFFKYFYLE
jgi:FKBP-type peptidyl-prolyl cis-trans isomerase 2